MHDQGIITVEVDIVQRAIGMLSVQRRLVSAEVHFANPWCG